MTKAEQISAELNYWSALLLKAELLGEAYDQDYENERTKFVFVDGSVAIFDGYAYTIDTYISKSDVVRDDR